ncbi:MAG: hypothetical protein LZF62_50127 [Nitrospira sp.]|nr:MAG: hypothetical protein LZF62_50127 [Nitrospira sp.]
MVAEAHIPDSGKTGLHGASCQFGGFQQRHGRGLPLHGCDHIGFSAQAEVDMAIDEAGEEGQAPAVDASGASRQTYRVVWSDGHNAIPFNHDGASLNFPALAVEDANLADRDSHGASLIGMVTMTPPMMSLSL